MITAQNLVNFGMDYASLGDAVGEQVNHLLYGRWSEDYITDGALSLIRSRLMGYHHNLDELIELCCKSRKNK